MLADDSLGLGSASLSVGLFVNDFVPNADSVIGDFSICTAPGCATVGCDTAGPASFRDAATGAWVIAISPLNNGNWISSSTTGLPFSAYGGVVFVRGTGLVMFSTRFDGAQSIGAVGDGFEWEPQLTVNPGLLS